MLFQKTQTCPSDIIAGCIVRKDDDSTNDGLLNDTNFNQKKYVDFV